MENTHYFNSRILDLAIMVPTAVYPVIVENGEFFNIQYWLRAGKHSTGENQVPSLEYTDEYPYPSKKIAIENGYRDFGVFAVAKNKHVPNIFQDLYNEHFN